MNGYLQGLLGFYICNIEPTVYYAVQILSWQTGGEMLMFSNLITLISIVVCVVLQA